MKFFSTLAFVALICFNGFSQSEGYISVKSTTTIQLKATEITYTAPSNPMENSMFGALSMLDDEEDFNEYADEELLAELAKALGRKGYKFETIASPSGSKFSITVKSPEALNELKELIETVGTTGLVTNVKYEDPAVYYESIFKQLSEDATNQANIIAKLNNATIGGLNSVSEVEQQAFDMSSYMNMLGESGAMKEMFGMGDKPLTKKYTKEMIFTFSKILSK